MRRRTLLVLAAATAGAYVLRRKVGLHEDLDWEEIDKPGSMEYIDGYGIHYLDQGHGPAVLLIHGFGGHTYSYRELAPRLARDHRTVAVDLKGFGYSQRRADAGLSHTDQARMLAALLDRLGIERAVVVGHSMGGAVAQRFAAMYPERCEALVLAAAAIGDRFRRHLPGPLLPVLRPLLPVLGGIAANRLFGAMFYERPPDAAAIKAEYVRPARIRGSMDGLMAMMRDVARDGEVDTRRITMPVLLLYGAHDAIVPLSVAQEIRSRIPHARLVVVERAAHGLLEERPDECEGAIRDFLRETAGAHGAVVAAASD